MLKKIIIMGAAGRDFHNFNVRYRDNEDYQVVAFTATQIPDIDGRKYPAELAGKLYPNGIPIYDEEMLPQLIKEHNIEEVVFAYSDVPYDYLGHRLSIVNGSGADFTFLNPESTMIKSVKPLVAVCAVRTGVGKSQTTRAVCKKLKEMGHNVVAIRHPMPYGDLVKQAVQRFATYADLDVHECTIEEREEYEPHIDKGIIVYSGVDYEAILREAEKEADVIVWDGGNNDTPFYKPDLLITLVDPHRAGNELAYYPGETNLRIADVCLINKVDTARFDDINTVRENISMANPQAVVIDGASPIFVNNSEEIRGKRVLVIEDGPTLTHGEMTYGAGVVAAKKFGAGELVDPRPYAKGTLAETFKKYSHITEILPAMGYGEKQMKDLQETIDSIPCDLVIAATPIDLTRVIKVNKPMLRVYYELEEIGEPKLCEVLKKFQK
ncbi:cyclic 2,3-diphosphoglycerate synthase [Clostridium sp. 'deep sea']|uniref:cyclic 2,3-diphosphoglycerate synthase n=1 Tax=Clostridium sp. 'deep sea' TaxID=2779445 RepID=UPI00325FCF19